MDKILREKFNSNFTEEKYRSYMQELEAPYPNALEFRNAETPIFIPTDFKNKIISACEEIVNIIVAPNFKTLTNNSVPANFNVPNEDQHPQFLVFDFGVCRNASDELEPQLIEMQGFPSLFAYQAHLSTNTEKYADIPEDYSSYLNGYNRESSMALLKEIILGNHTAEEVILLEIKPETQKTRIDFLCTEEETGIKTVCVTKVYAEGDKLFYNDAGGKKVPIKRIYNRLIFDDLKQYSDLKLIDFTRPYDVEWVPHPNWFYRISKYTLPFIDHPYVPDTFFLHEVKEPVNLDEYVLKPLYSFAGMGVIIDIQQEDIDSIADPENWILQKKVTYDDVIQTPDGPAKAEIRIFYFWKDGWKRPVAVHNLARLSKGKMIGTRYNHDKTWVGGSIAYFKK